MFVIAFTFTLAPKHTWFHREMRMLKYVMEYGIVAKFLLFISEISYNHIDLIGRTVGANLHTFVKSDL